MDKKAYISTVEAYFLSLDKRNLDEVLAHFSDDAVFTVQSAFITCSGHAEIRAMFEQFLHTYSSVLHTDFEHIVDTEGEAIASRFRVELDNQDGSHETKKSTNQWYFENGLFQRVYVWISGDNVLGE